MYHKQTSNDEKICYSFCIICVLTIACLLQNLKFTRYLILFLKWKFICKYLNYYCNKIPHNYSLQRRFILGYKLYYSSAIYRYRRGLVSGGYICWVLTWTKWDTSFPTLPLFSRRPCLLSTLQVIVWPSDGTFPNRINVSQYSYLSWNSRGILQTFVLLSNQNIKTFEV